MFADHDRCSIAGNAAKFFFNAREGRGRSWWLDILQLLLVDDLTVFENIASGHSALILLVFELLDTFPVLEIHPNIDPSIAIGVGLLGDDFAFIVKSSKVKYSISLSVAFFAYEL